MRANYGFTLIETMVTLAIAVILITVAVPSFLTFIQNARLSSQASDLTTAMMYARSEAVARNQQVTIGSTDNTANWGGGYQVKLQDGTVLRAYSALSGGNHLTGPASLVFNSSGYKNPINPSISMQLCDSRNISRQIILSGQGRAQYCSCDPHSTSPPYCASSTVYSSADCATACP
jgi:type IV fimbrial biogenesis protein FimT